ncbi:hypothetical protein GCM10025864_00300 [Luteimicrobium album]|uniref:Uncharacterized protein n=1 Tax=Luteimicrobium album TaxID=1054550 RepID=A0ABQ6HUR5_9MICO|nr:hypothetical protein [Luteimicrobium album]GMA22271.1 hypothetical protein GCM10025864_00300 [Luteimicrobium album]
MIAVDELYTTARTLTAAPHGLLRRVNALIPHASNTVAESQLGGRADIHRIPWNGPAANLALDIAAAVRRHESTLTLLLFQQARFRPDGDRQTLDAIGRLPVLVDHAIASGHGGRPPVRDAAHDLTAWARRCRALLDEAHDDEQPWTPAPSALPPCPDCNRRLYLAPGWQYAGDAADVLCRTCRDDDGQPLRWDAGTWLAVLAHRSAATAA